MKKTKILTVLGVLLAMGITACGGGNGGNKKSSTQQGGGTSSQQGGGGESSQQGGGTSSQQAAQKDATGHIWGADADVAASGNGVAYKKANCTENDSFIRVKVNQSAVTNANRKDGPDGYLKLASDGNTCSFKFNYDSYATGMLYFYGCMDGYSTEGNRNAGFYRGGTPSISLTLNGEAVDFSAQQSKSYKDYFGEEYITTDRTDSGQYLSNEGYAPLGEIALEEGENELVYGRVQTQNMLIKDFVFVVKNGTKPPHTHVADTEWHKDATNHWHECVSGDNYKMESAAHDFGAWVETPAAEPCKDKGSKARTCSVCGYVETDELPLVDHTWVDDPAKEDVPATCIAGKHFEVCSVCGETRETAIAKDPDAEHDFGEWEVVNAASCKQGLKKRTCSRCGMEETAVIPPLEGAEHAWGEVETVADVTHVDNTDPDNPKTVIDYVGYEKQVCETCGTWRVVMSAAKGTLGEGSSLKDHADLEAEGIHGYKLNGNGQYFEYKFKFDTRADVVIYQVGAMDNFTSNGNVTYYTRKDGKDLPNFQFDVNNTAVDLSEMHDVKASDAVKTRADDDPLKAKNYSTFEEIKIGEAELVNGDNTFRYTRLESYNYIITDIVLEVTPVDHVHEAGENWVDTDATYHWKNCTHGDGHKMEKAKHDYEGQEWEVVEESTCSKKGTRRRSCKVCGHWQVEEMPLAEHNYVEDTTQAVAPTHTSEGKKVEVCSVCGDVHETVLPKVEHTWGDAGASVGDAVTHSCTGCDAVCYELAVASPAKLKTDLSWNIAGLPVAKYEVHLFACIADGDNISQSLISGNVSRYQFRVDEGAYVNTGNNTYRGFGFGAGEKLANCQWTKTLCEIDVGEGAASFEIHWTNKGYSAFIAAVRLVKIATAAE